MDVKVASGRSQRKHSKSLWITALGVLSVFFGTLVWANPDATAPPEETALIQLFERVSPAVVAVVAKRPPQQATGAERESRSSGFFIDRDGGLLTTAHVLHQASQITAILDDRRAVAARVVGLDLALNVALLKVEPPAPSVVIPSFGDSNGVQVGQRAVLIGNPMGLNQIMGVGVVSGMSPLLGTDNNNFEAKQLYVDFRVPQIPLGHRFNIGGFPAEVTPLHTNLIFSNDAGGGNVRFDFTDQISLLVHYIQLEEDLDRFAGSSKVGEDYVASGTLMLKPLPELDLHLPLVFGHLQQPFGSSLTGTIGPFAAVDGATVNVATEDRYYVGFDARYRLGDLRIEPTFIYLFGDRKFTDGSDIDFAAFGTQLSLQYATGPWSFQLKGVYATGNKATDDINNTQAPGSRREDVERFFPLSPNAFHRFGENFEILGRQITSFRPDLLGRTPGGQAGFDRFGLIHVGLRPQYKLTDRLTLEGAVGAFWTAENTACPAVLRRASTTDPRGFTCTNPRSDFTGNSKHLGYEVDVGTIYTIMPGLTWQMRFGYAFLGDAFQIENRNVRDAWVLVNRLLYTF